MLMELLQADEQVGSQVANISPSTLYFHLKQAGHEFRGRGADPPSGTYRRFEADYPNQLWQGDARHGIPLPHPDKAGKRKMTYLFGWVDDFSRKIMAARYYWDEKLPRMEDCFRRAVLRWGRPEKCYCDNGKVYLSKHFLILTSDLGIKKIHHRAYAAWCKGKIELVAKNRLTTSSPSIYMMPRTGIIESQSPCHFSTISLLSALGYCRAPRRVGHSHRELSGTGGGRLPEF